MDGKYMPALISLSAGFLVCILCIVNKVEIIKSLLLVLGFLLGFYIIGILTKKIFEKILTKEEVVKSDTVKDDVIEEEVINEDNSSDTPN